MSLCVAASHNVPTVVPRPPRVRAGRTERERACGMFAPPEHVAEPQTHFAWF